MSHKKYRTETNCLNCGAEVTGKFCPNCGQENLETRENFFHLAFHFVSDYFHFDSKFFRSLIPLFTKPGFLTKEYWEGRRVHYIHPLRLFFFITILFAISTSYFYNRFGEEMKGKMINPDKVLATFDSAYLASTPDTSRLFVPRWGDTVTIAVIKQLKEKDARQIRKFSSGFDVVFVNLKYVTFFLLPVYALIFKLLYIRRKSFYVDHLVYAMHVQAFVYCLFSLTLLLPFIIPIDLVIMRQLSVLIILVYLFFSLNYLYRQKWWKTILKSLIATALLVFITMLSIMGIAFVDAIFIQK